MGTAPLIFISHSATDTWVARQISGHLREIGVGTFLDESDIQRGDDFEQKIWEAATAATELVVLLTPWSLERPFVWLEIGAFWGDGKRIVGVLHGLKINEVLSKGVVPVLLKRLQLVDINDIDLYFNELRKRVSELQQTSYEIS